MKAPGCWYSGNHWWCNNRVGAPVYQAGSEQVVAGYMYSNPSWFVCRTEGGAHSGGPHPTRHIWTQADNGAWGWMHDDQISSETNPLPTC
ncbi:hypothetical protein ACSNOH_25980 [Streptomyces sp. URMC 127]|uniref:hypothetical protein n=1 Tax=Streptomyces sp. URMC 127 TaxID=3423402 RepID=UPI003F1D822B